MDRSQLAAFRRTLQVAANDLTGPDAARVLRDAAKAERERVLREQGQRAGIAPTDVIVADGRRGASIDTADRVVIIEYGYLREIVQETLKALVARSPRRSGAYAGGFVVMVGGREIDELDEIDHDTTEVAIVNTMPYARKIEVGKTASGRNFVVQVEPRVVESVALEMGQRYGNLAQMKHTYFDLDGAYQLKRATRGQWKAYRQNAQSSGHRAGLDGRFGRGSKVGRTIRYPGLRIWPR